MDLEIVGHRGASGEAPENTLASVNLAWSQQADAVEIDVRLTRDGQIVAFHDANTFRTTGEKHDVCDSTLEELQRLDAGRWKGEQFRQERIPTLRQVLSTIPPGKRLYVEIKSSLEIVPALVAELASPAERERVVVIGYEFAVLAELKRRLPDLPALQVVRLAKKPKGTQEAAPDLAERIGQVQQAGLDGFDIGVTSLLEQSTVSRLLAERFQLCTWTINDAQEARRLEQMGIHAVTTDFPGRLSQELSAMAYETPGDGQELNASMVP